ncbi:hypothetical protein SAMN02745146_1663 [Hymenobacter daecheongensis DSM 21074]|uniref:Uncharacterized protein n=1 Tax=Hymenobacter daecheongensis DSM 21074 TaxID=1121955 RepID=A0A1M6EE71_9BACT|nr:hypothetical protein SAMN02745146_1663 [Hymenobacter daecheongensis DSM 21074]
MGKKMFPLFFTAPGNPSPLAAIYPDNCGLKAGLVSTEPHLRSFLLFQPE